MNYPLLIDVLKAAALNRHWDMIKFLIEESEKTIYYKKVVSHIFRPDIPLTGKLLSELTQEGDLEMIKFLVKHGADIQANSNAALVTSVYYDKPEITEYIKSIVTTPKIVRESIIDEFSDELNEGFVKKAAVLATMFLSFLAVKNIDFKPSKERLINSPIIQDMARQPNLDKSDIYRGFEELYNKELRQKRVNYKDPLTLTTSKDAKDFIKQHERLRLSAYTLGDKIGGKKAITIGYGHAKPYDQSKYKVGDKISRAEAERLFEEDVKRKEEGVKRIFRQWKEQGIDIKITQGMFDSMVSMAFNMGISGLRRSDVIQEVKKGDFHAALEKIPNERIGEKFSSGLKKRREAEAELFAKGM